MAGRAPAFDGPTRDSELRVVPCTRLLRRAGERDGHPAVIDVPPDDAGPPCAEMTTVALRFPSAIVNRRWVFIDSRSLHRLEKWSAETRA